MNPNLQNLGESAGWQRCLDSAEKDSLLQFIDQRYQDRFFEPIRRLLDSPDQFDGYGFAIMALCSLLIESIQCFRYGLPTTHEAEYRNSLGAFSPTGICQITQAEHRNGKQAFEDFFSRDVHKTLFPKVDGGVFYSAIRNGLLHQAQTKQGWRIRSDKPELWNSTGRVLNRTKIAKSLEAAFAKYIEELKAASWDDDIWLKARRKIWWLLQLSA